VFGDPTQESAVATPPATVRRSTVGTGVRSAATRPRFPGRAPVLLLTLSLAIATAVALLVASAALSPPPTSAPVSVDDRQVVYRFYEGVNRVLRSGDGAGLAGVVTPDLITHDERSRVDLDLTGFARHVAALGDADPSLQLVVEEVLVEGDRAAVRLRPRSERSDALFGVSPEQQAVPWAAVDLLRLADGRVAERWAIGDPGVLLRPVLRARLDPGPLDVGTLGLARFTFAPGASTKLVDGAAPVVFVVEAGELRLRAAGSMHFSDPVGFNGGIADSTDRVLRRGDAVAIQDGAWFDLRNESEAPAVMLGFALTAALAQPGAVLSWGRTRDSGIAVESLAVRAQVARPSGPVAVALYRVTLGARAGLAPHAAAGVELLAVASGQLRLAVDGAAIGFDHGIPLPVGAPGAGGAAPVIPGRPDDGTSSSGLGGESGADIDLVLSSSAAAITYGGAVVGLRNPGDLPAEVWVVTLVPADSDQGAA
jgi:predicted ester cyclase